MKTKQPTDDQIIAAMLRYGGSFMRAIANAYVVADSRNKERIRQTWAEQWSWYADMASGPYTPPDDGLNR
jgi:hypothetical protein